MIVRRCVAALAIAFAVAMPPAHATNVSVDVTDIWWPDNEPGWGIQFVQNAGLVFATMYVYGPDNEPIFFVAVLNKVAGADTWSGEVYQATGTFFAEPWNPADRQEFLAGTMTFALNGVASGTLTYTIGPTTIVKTIARQALALEDNAGDYRITHTWTPSGAGCTAADAYSASAGPVSGDLAIQRINPETALVSLTWQHNPVDVCSMTATYTQVGRYGSYTGNLSCPSSGKAGTLTIFEVLNRPKMLTAGYLMDWSYGCTRTGQLTAIMGQP
jgi:hypothetical protein